LLCGKIYQKEEKMVEPTEFKEMLKGVTAIMVTPYTDEGEVSEERLRNHINFWMKVSSKYGPSIEPSLLKGAAALAGSPGGPVRLPVPKFDENEKEQLKKIIEDLGLIG